MEYFRDSINQHREINYEDIYNLVKQIRDSFLTEYINPLVKPFLDQYGDKLLCFALKVKAEKPTDIQDLFRILDEHIVSILVQKLNWKNIETDSISSFWKAVYDDNDFKKYDLFTLNNDEVLERTFIASGIPFNDGFEAGRGNDYRIWNDNSYRMHSVKIHLYKLHGSINWTYNSDIKKVVIEKLHDYRTPEDRRGTGCTHPEILIGTYYKMLEYTGGIYRDLFYLLRKQLFKSDCLIICGYGFGDKGINNYFHDWIDSSDNRMAVVIHKDTNDLVRNAQPSISYRWKALINNGKLKVIPSWMEDTDWNSVRELF